MNIYTCIASVHASPESAMGRERHVPLRERQLPSRAVRPARLLAPSSRRLRALWRGSGCAVRSGGRAWRACWLPVTSRRPGSGCIGCCEPMKSPYALLECKLCACSPSTPPPSRDFHAWRRLVRRGAGAGVDWAFGAVCSRRVCSVLLCSVGLRLCAVQCSAARVLLGRPCIVRALVSRARALGRGASCLPRAGRVQGGAAARSRTFIHCSSGERFSFGDDNTLAHLAWRTTPPIVVA